jgi:LemA protein
MAPALNKLLAVSEAYPQLRASENFLALQQELADIEDKLAAARRYYNQTVYRYNTVKQSFPAVVIAGRSASRSASSSRPTSATP